MTATAASSAGRPSRRPRLVRRRLLLITLLLTLLSTAVPVCGDEPKSPDNPLQPLMADLMRVVPEIVSEHRALYLGEGKTPEQASQIPAILWHMGDAMTRGGDLTKTFEPAFALGQQRDAAKLEALAKRVAELRPESEALARKTHEMAARVAARAAEELEPIVLLSDGQPNDAWLAAQVSEPGWLLARAVDALGPGAKDTRRARACLAELAGRLEHLADLDRWLALNCTWLEETQRWTKTEGVAPRTLCYSIQCRYNEAATIQSRVEDVLFVTQAEKAVWPWVVARAVDLKTSDAAKPKELIDSLPAMRQEIETLRAAEVALDREVAALCHERKIKESYARRLKEYMPLVVKLESLRREAAIAAWVAAAPPKRTVCDETPYAARLSPAARAALADVTRQLDDRARAAVRPLLAEMIRSDYLGSYADLSFYQAAVMDTAAPLATRLSRWATLQKKPMVRGLVDMLHPSPGVMSTAQRGDNAYDPRLMAWAATCQGKTAMARFTEARDRVNAFYRQHGYNQDKPVCTVRDALDSGLVDCIAASRLHGAVAVAAGVEGVVPVRLWRDRTGHSFLGLRTGMGLMLLDPLNRAAPQKYPIGGSGVVTIESGVPSFGSYVVDDVRIIATGVRLHRDVPYLSADDSGDK